MATEGKRWFIEDNNPAETLIRGVRRSLASEQSTFQSIDIIDSITHGKCLVLDGKIQSSESDEYIYHETLVHPALITQGQPRNVLIIGGGEGATSREALRYPGVRRVTMVDIDRRVVELSKKHLPEWHRGAFRDPRSRVVIGDGRKYLWNSRERFDVIILDISEPVYAGPAYLLFTLEFYRKVKQKLTPRGTVALQAGTTRCGELLSLTSVHATLREVFPLVRIFQAFVPSFTMPWGFALASLGDDPAGFAPPEVDDRIRAAAVRGLRFYDGTAHQGMFSLSKDLRAALSRPQRIIRDRHPIFTSS